MTAELLTTLDHQGIETTQIDRDVAFYGEQLGMTLIRWGIHGSTGRRIALLHDGALSKIELIEVEESTGELAHTAYRVQRIESVHAATAAAGFVEVQPIFRIEAARATSSFVRSPSGHLVQLIEYDADSPDLTPLQWVMAPA